MKYKDLDRVTYNHDFVFNVECSKCGYDLSTLIQDKNLQFCPKCGAKLTLVPTLIKKDEILEFLNSRIKTKPVANTETPQCGV